MATNRQRNCFISAEILLSRLRSYFIRNPFEDVMLDAIRVGFLPHRTVGELLQSHYRRRYLLRPLLLLTVQLVSVVRVLLMLLWPDFEHYRLWVGFFYGLANIRAWFMVVLLMMTLVVSECKEQKGKGLDRVRSLTSFSPLLVATILL